MMRSRWVASALAVFALFLIVGGSFVVVARTEENDAFCASCHTEPEVTYFARAQAVNATDLASAHAMLARGGDGDHPAAARCIDCHSAPGLMGRVTAMSLGVRDAIKWFTSAAVQPAVQTTPIGDANCLKCHADAPNDGRFDMHSHRHLARWQQADRNAATCVTCHTSHTTDGNATLGFLQQQRTLAECDRCHVALGVVNVVK
jgi:hypothetical protein